LPTAEQVTDKRIGRFKQRITETLDTADLKAFRKMVEDYQHEYGVPVIEIAAALGALAQGQKSSATSPAAAGSEKKREYPAAAAETGPRRKTAPVPERKNPPATVPKAAPRREPEAQSAPDHGAAPKPPQKPDLGAPLRAVPARRREGAAADAGMECYRIEVGLQHGVKPGNIVGAIANEAEIESEYIGRIEIFDDHSTVQLPEGMPKEIFKHLKNVWVSGQRLQISRLDQQGKPSQRPAPDKSRRPAAEGDKPAAKKPGKPRKPK